MVKVFKICFVLIIYIILTITNTTAFAYLNYSYDDVSKAKNNKIRIGFFRLEEECACIANLIINQAFYDEYMVFNGEQYIWCRDQYNNIINREEIENLTPLGTIIKSDVCYEVISSRYNLIDHGIPNDNTPLSWALRPIKLEYVPGWAYSPNRVVKTQNNQYFMARFYTTANPLINRIGWDKIEPIQKTDFECYENTTMPNYSKPYKSQIKRSYIWDAYTTYLVDDVVSYNGVEYIAIYLSNNKTPSSNAWAWQIA